MTHKWMVVLGWALGIAHGLSHAQATPEGTWASYNDAHTQVQAWVRIERQHNVWVGIIDKVLDPEASPTEKCTACKGSKRNQPILGLTIIEGLPVQAHSAQTWRGGTILDPQSGEEYRLEVTLADQGRILNVRGYWGPFWRTQKWLRVPN